MYRLRRLVLMMALVSGLALVLNRPAHAQGGLCDTMVYTETLIFGEQNCQGLANNFACYGYPAAIASPDTVVFSTPGHRAEVLEFQSVSTRRELGTVLMRLKTNLGPVKVVLFGDAGVSPIAPDSDVFIMRMEGETDLCERTPPGMVVYTDKGKSGHVKINGVDIVLKSAAFITMKGSSLDELDPALREQLNELTVYSLETGNWGIYLSQSDGSDTRPLVQSGANNYHAAWSPDASQIAFQSNRDGNNEVYVMDVSTQQVQRLTNHPAYDIHPAWSPKSDQIAFDSNRDDDFDIYVVDADGQNLRQLTDNQAQDRWANWTHDGRRIAFYSDQDGDRNIYAMNADGSNLQRLTDDPADDRYPAWSLNDRQIAFASDRDGDWEIYVMDDDGANVRQLTNNDDATDWGPVWTPDGRISFASVRNDDPTNNEIYVMDADGGDIQRLTNNRWHDELPLWRPLIDAQVDLMTVTNLTGTVVVSAVVPATGLVIQELAPGEAVDITLVYNTPITITVPYPSEYYTSPVARWLVDNPAGLPGMVEPTCGGPIDYGGTVTAEVSTPSEECVYAFTGTAGDIVSIVMDSVSNTSVEFSEQLVPSLDLRDDTPAVVRSSAGVDDSGVASIQEYQLARSGTYKIVARSDAYTSTGPFALTLSKVDPTCWVVTSALNLRSGPGIVYTPIGGLSQGETMEPLGRYGGWIQVNVDRTSGRGWVSSGDRYIACNIDLATLPVVPPPPVPVPPVPVPPVPVSPVPVPPVPVPPVPVPPAPVPPTPGIATWTLPPEQIAVNGACYPCKVLTWDVPGALELYLDGQRKPLQGDFLACLSESDQYAFSSGSGTERIYSYNFLVRTGTGDVQHQVWVRWVSPTISFRADKTMLAPGESTTLRWDVENVKEVYLDGEGVVGQDSRQVTIGDSPRTFRLRVVTECDEVERQITVDVAANARLRLFGPNCNDGTCGAGIVPGSIAWETQSAACQSMTPERVTWQDSQGNVQDYVGLLSHDASSDYGAVLIPVTGGIGTGVDYLSPALPVEYPVEVMGICQIQGGIPVIQIPDGTPYFLRAVQPMSRS